MTISHIIAAIEDFAPLSLQEEWDNSGLQIGLPPESDGECTGVLLCIDVTPAVIAEAAAKGCNLVVSHHPLIFKGLKHLAGRTLQERAAVAAIRAGIAVYSSHTALDSTRGGISYAMAERLGARALRALAPASVPMVKMSVTCPRTKAEDVRLILLDSIPSADFFDLTAESLRADGDIPGSFSIVHEPLCRVEAKVRASEVARISATLASAPCAGSLRIDTTPAGNSDSGEGLGVLAVFDEPVDMAELLKRLHERFGTPCIRASRGYDPAAKVRTLALCGGSGGEFIAAARSAGAQAYVTADVRYHDFADAEESPMAIFDIGHFESERCAEDIFQKIINNKFPNFKVLCSEAESCPVLYL